MSLLSVSNDSNHHGNFKGKSRVTHCENSKSRITLLCPITHHADYLGSIMRHGNPYATLYKEVGGSTVSKKKVKGSTRYRRLLFKRRIAPSTG